MRMNIDLDEDDLPVGRSDLVGYYHPREIVADASLSIERRRSLLAFWMSDANALSGVPWLRSSGHVTASLADLRKALDDLDEVEAMLASRAAVRSQQTAA